MIELEQLNEGWPFGDGPNRWPLIMEHRGATDSQAAGIHLCCARCQQSVTRVGRWSVTLEHLKPQVAGHVMQVHPEAIVR